MMFALGLLSGVVVTFVGFVIVMAPKHWEWWQENVELKKALTKAIDRGDHYKQLSTPNQWGPVDQHEARIVAKPRTYPDVDAGPIEHRFDDIMDGGK